MSEDKNGIGYRIILYGSAALIVAATFYFVVF